jgi:hypothetical protein
VAIENFQVCLRLVFVIRKPKQCYTLLYSDRSLSGACFLFQPHFLVEEYCPAILCNGLLTSLRYTSDGCHMIYIQNSDGQTVVKWRLSGPKGQGNITGRFSRREAIMRLAQDRTNRGLHDLLRGYLTLLEPRIV